MAVRKLKPIEERDPYAALVLESFDKFESDKQQKKIQVRFDKWWASKICSNDETPIGRQIKAYAMEGFFAGYKANN